MPINLHPIYSKQFKDYRQKRDELLRYIEQIFAKDPSTPVELLQEIMTTTKYHAVQGRIAANPNTSFSVLLHLTPLCPAEVANNPSWQLFSFLKPEFVSAGNMPTTMLYLLICNSQKFSIWHQMASHQTSLACWWQALKHPELQSESIERIFNKMPDWNAETFSQVFFMWRRLVLQAIILHSNTPKILLDILAFDDDPQIAHNANLETRMNSYAWKLQNCQSGVPETIFRAIAQHSQYGRKTVLEYHQTLNLPQTWHRSYDTKKPAPDVPSLSEVNQPDYRHWQRDQDKVFRYTDTHNPWLEVIGFPSTLTYPDTTPAWGDTVILEHLRKHGQTPPDLYTRMAWCRVYFTGTTKRRFTQAQTDAFIFELRKRMR